MSEVKKGQKYRADGFTFTILSDVFEGLNGSEYVAYSDNISDEVHLTRAAVWGSSEYTLIREPKFKVGDRVEYYDVTYEIVAVTSKPDSEGDFGYLGLSSDGYFSTFDDSYNNLKAAS